MTSQAGLAAVNFVRQGLDRSFDDPAALVTSLVGVYSTSKTCHLALMARIDGYSPNDLEPYERDRRFVRMAAMRSSSYLIAVQDVPMVAAATRHSSLRSCWSILKSFMDRSAFEGLAQEIEDLLTARALSSTEIRTALAPSDPQTAEAVKYVVRMMAAENRIVKAGTQGGWRSDRVRYARWADWLPEVDPYSMEEADAQAELCRRYFATYGPAAPEDFGWWAGVKRQDHLSKIVAAAGLQANPDGLIGEPEDAPRPGGVRLLPVWDNVLMSHRHRSRVVPLEFYDRVYDFSGNGTSVVLVSGRVAGIWDMADDKKDILVRVAPLKPFSAATWKRVESEAARLGNAVGMADVRLMRCSDPPSLKDGPRNLFLSPLRDRTPS
ncbi:MAG: winged helix DNA-binding domain-containing protein [Actinomycetota bacterium]